MTETILAIISFAIIAIYLIAYVITRGLPTSISVTYYHTESKLLFPVVVALCAALAWVPLIRVTPENIQFLAFLICGSLVFVAASPAFKEDLVGKVHTGAAVTLGLAALAWIIVASGMPYATILGVIIGVILRRNFVFWLEAGILIDIYTNLFVLLHICSSAGA